MQAFLPLATLVGFLAAPPALVAGAFTTTRCDNQIISSFESIERFYDTGDWTGSVTLDDWRDGDLLTFNFGDSAAQIVDAAYSTVVDQQALETTIRLDHSPDTRQHKQVKVLVHGKGGCWASRSTSACTTTVACHNSPTPSPPPALRGGEAPQTILAPHVISGNCGTAQLVWEKPRGFDGLMLEYEVVVIKLQGHMYESFETKAMEYDVQGLEPDEAYIFQVRSKVAVFGSFETQGGPLTNYRTPPDKTDAKEIVIVPEVSTDSCSSLQLALPPIPECSTKEDYVAVEWRTAREDDLWDSLMDRVDEEDTLPGKVLVVDDLNPYAVYRFRALLHHFGDRQVGSDKPKARGRVLTGPATGALLVGMLPDELLRAPMVTATGSASFDIALPPISPCRSKLHSSVWYSFADAEEEWLLLPTEGVERHARHVIANALRCPVACRFRLVHDNLVGWTEPSLASSIVAAPELPELEPSRQRLEVKLGVRPRELLPPVDLADREAWEAQFEDDLSEALGLPPAEVSAISVVEVRGSGAYVVFDVPHSTRAAAEAPPTKPLEVLEELMRQPACVEANLALDQPGKCSSTCGGNASAPALVNDGNLRQYAPHAWTPCPSDERPWWSVQLAAPQTNPYVRVFLGEMAGSGTAQDSTFLEVYLGDAAGLHPTATKCEDLVAGAGSVTGTVCEGIGSWITIASRDGAPFALAEVQACASTDVNALLRFPTTGSIDLAGGILQVHDAGTRAAQMAPSLLPFSPSGRDASWRQPPKGLEAPPMLLLGASVALLALLLAAACLLISCCRGGFRCCSCSICSSSRRDTFSRVAVSESRVEESVPFEDDEELMGGGETVEPPSQPLRLKRMTSLLSMDVTFERSDGKVESSVVDVSGVSEVDEALQVVREAAAVAFGFAVDHVSLQYMDTQTGVTEQAWYDPILGEGSSFDALMAAPGWRVLALGRTSYASEELAAVDDADGALSGGEDDVEFGLDPVPSAPPELPVDAPLSFSASARDGVVEMQLERL